MTHGNAPLRIAHAYGNSRKSLQCALAAAIDIIEADIWFRAGEVYVRHEPRLGCLPLLVDRRMWGHPLPPLSLPLWSNFYARPDINVLRLGELLDTVAGTKRLLLDVKGEYREKKIDEFARTLIGKIAEHGAESYVAVCGQFWPVLHRLPDLAPELEVRYSIEKAMQWERFVGMVEHGAAAHKVCIEHTFLSDGKMRFLEEHSVSAYCWTVDDGHEAARLVAMGVDGIISNDLKMLASLSQISLP